VAFRPARAMTWEVLLEVVRCHSRNDETSELHLVVSSSHCSRNAAIGAVVSVIMTSALLVADTLSTAKSANRQQCQC